MDVDSRTIELNKYFFLLALFYHSKKIYLF